MSESQQFANYSNSAQALKSNIDQLGATDTQVTDDANNFEQQFLIGIGVHAKTQLSEKLIALAKKSKTVKKVANTIKDVKDTVDDLSKKLTSKIPKLDSTPNPLNPSASPENLKQLKSLSDAAAEKAANTAKAVGDAENEVIDSRDALRTAGETRDAAEALAETRQAGLVAKAGGTIAQSEQDAASAARIAANEARSGVDQAVQRSADAEKNLQSLAQQSTQHEADSLRAAQDLKTAASAEEDIAPVVSGTEKAVADAEKLGKALKVSKDVEEGSVAEDEADPLGLIFTAVTSAVTQIIGRKLKAHENKITSSLPPAAKLSFTSTLGA